LIRPAETNPKLPDISLTRTSQMTLTRLGDSFSKGGQVRSGWSCGLSRQCPLTLLAEGLDLGFSKTMNGEEWVSRGVSGRGSKSEWVGDRCEDD
jgi:hypothetical protein